MVWHSAFFYWVTGGKWEMGGIEALTQEEATILRGMFGMVQSADQVSQQSGPGSEFNRH